MDREVTGLITNWPQYLTAAVLVMVRLSGLMVFAPVFSSSAIAPRIKAGFVFALTILLAPAVVMVPGARAVLDGRAMLGELGVGLIFGLSLMLLNEALTFAGTLLGLQFSFSLVNLLDPNSMIETAVLGQMLSWLGILVIIGSGLDRSLLAAMVRSFSAVPVGQAVIQAKTGVCVGHDGERDLSCRSSVGCPCNGCSVGGGGDDCSGSTFVSTAAFDCGEHSDEDDSVVCGIDREFGSVAGLDRTTLYGAAGCCRKAVGARMTATKKRTLATLRTHRSLRIEVVWLLAEMCVVGEGYGG